MWITRRGLALLGMGILLISAAFVIGERDLALIGAFLCTLPLFVWAVMVFRRPHLRFERSLHPTQVSIDESTTIGIDIHNDGRTASTTVLLEDRLPPRLHESPRLIVERLPARSATRMNYSLQAQRRGIFPLGPIRTRVSDPFGMVKHTSVTPVMDDLVVTPRLQALRGRSLVGGSGFNTGTSSSHIAVSGDDDIAVREYRRGDDLRRVHWKSSARRGELMVRREEQTWEKSAVLWLDTRAEAFGTDSNGPVFEWMVSACASVAACLAGNGKVPDLLANGAVVPGGTSPAILRHLATVEDNDHHGTASWNAVFELTEAMREGVSLVAFLGDITDEEAQLVAATATGGGDRIAFCAQGTNRGWARLREAGWSVRCVTADSDLPRLWQELGSVGSNGV
ncbi:DUF58 domain-containing protein [Haloglycomyces albus]|uniref:DUF58 domain-containing protein n=1 Tax=Haloglycomyces albus TaxID=526067 RepID=UPI0004B4DE8A|nr:DUF58 domain-containing protein [Haloglycomyces albus]